jgi:hypothetical protein
MCCAFELTSNSNQSARVKEECRRPFPYKQQIVVDLLFARVRPTENRGSVVLSVQNRRSAYETRSKLGQAVFPVVLRSATEHETRKA